MCGIEAPLWNPGPLVLELHSKSLPRNWIKILPLATHQSVNVQPSQRSHTARAPSLQSLQLMEALVEEPGEVGLIPCNLLQGRLVRQEALPSHVPKIPLYLLGLKLGSFGLPLGASYGSFQQPFRLFVSGLGDLLYDRTHQPGCPALVAFPEVTVGKTRYRDTLEQLLRVYFSLGNFIGAPHRTPDD